MTEATHPQNANGNADGAAGGNGHDEKVASDALEQRVDDGPRGGAQTWYDVLEVTIDASDADVKKAYDRALALVEGRNIGGYLMLDPIAAEAARADVEAAFKVLGDADRRSAYDNKLREQGRAPKAAAPTTTPTDGAPADAKAAADTAATIPTAPASSVASSSSSDVFAPQSTTIMSAKPGDSLETANDEDVFEDRASREAREAKELLAVADDQQAPKPPPSSSDAPITQLVAAPASLQKPPPLPHKPTTTATTSAATTATTTTSAAPTSAAMTSATTTSAATTSAAMTSAAMTSAATTTSATTTSAATMSAATTSAPPVSTSKPPMSSALKFLAPTIDNDPLASQPTAVGIRFEAPKTDDGPVPSSMAPVTVPSGLPVNTSTNIRELDKPKPATTPTPATTTATATTATTATTTTAPGARATSAPVMDQGDLHSAPTVPVFRTPLAAAMMGEKTEAMSLKAIQAAVAEPPLPRASSTAQAAAVQSTVQGAEGVGAVIPVAGSPPPPSTGLPDGDLPPTILKDLREKRGLSLDQMAEATKIRKPYLKAIEEADVPNLPARVYLRGFLTQIARVLKVDKARLADGYLATIEKLGGGGGAGGGAGGAGPA